MAEKETIWYNAKEIYIRTINYFELDKFNIKLLTTSLEFLLQSFIVFSNKSSYNSGELEQTAEFVRQNLLNKMGRTFRLGQYWDKHFVQQEIKVIYVEFYRKF